jgi:hypothetical protein
LRRRPRPKLGCGAKERRRRRRRRRKELTNRRIAIRPPINAFELFTGEYAAMMR